jgi:hypothetical protein
MQLTHAEFAKNLAQVAGATVRFLPGASRRAFPRIDVSRITAEFGLRQMPLISNLSDLLLAYRTS